MLQPYQHLPAQLAETPLNNQQIIHPRIGPTPPRSLIERHEGSLRDKPDPVPWSVAFLVSAVSSREAAANMSNKAAPQQIVAATNASIAAFIDSDDICPSWPWPGPSPWLSVIASQLTLVATPCKKAGCEKRHTRSRGPGARPGAGAEHGRSRASNRIEFNANENPNSAQQSGSIGESIALVYVAEPFSFTTVGDPGTGDTRHAAAREIG